MAGKVETTEKEPQSLSEVLIGAGDRSVILEIVLRGGSPWGFTLVGGVEYDRPITIAEVSTYRSV